MQPVSYYIFKIISQCNIIKLFIVLATPLVKSTLTTTTTKNAADGFKVNFYDVASLIYNCKLSHHNKFISLFNCNITMIPSFDRYNTKQLNDLETVEVNLHVLDT